MFNEPTDWGKRFQFPGNIQVEYDGFSGQVVNKIVVQMADKYDNFVAEQIAMGARAAGISDVTVLNKEAILEALQKQIPAKVKKEHRYFGLGECPRCKALFVDKTTYYCGDCGQALNWED